MGWLHAVPKLKANDASTETRQTKFANEGRQIDFPPCEMMYMVDYLFSAGPVTPTGMGSIPLTHQEILSWRSNMQVDLCPWEINALREMSRQYLSELVQSDKHDSPPPWVAEIDEEKGKMVAERVKDILRG